MQEDIYYNKYLEYKKKYLFLKNKLYGGVEPCSYFTLQLEIHNSVIKSLLTFLRFKIHEIFKNNNNNYDILGFKGKREQKFVLFKNVVIEEQKNPCHITIADIKISKDKNITFRDIKKTLMYDFNIKMYLEKIKDTDLVIFDVDFLGENEQFVVLKIDFRNKEMNNLLCYLNTFYNYNDKNKCPKIFGLNKLHITIGKIVKNYNKQEKKYDDLIVNDKEILTNIKKIIKFNIIDFFKKKPFSINDNIINNIISLKKDEIKLVFKSAGNQENKIITAEKIESVKKIEQFAEYYQQIFNNFDIQTNCEDDICSRLLSRRNARKQKIIEE